MRKLVVILGVPIDLLGISETLDRIERMVQVGRSCGRIHQVATVNADFVVRAQFDPELRYLLQQADLLTADGMPLVWGARWLGQSLEGRVAGADLVPLLAERAAQKGLSIYFLGGEPGVAARAAGLLKQEHPELRIAGIYSPPFSPVLEMETSFLEDIRLARPDILLVAFGNPKQEKWIGMYGSRVGVPVMIGVGGSLDFIAGHTRRAPEWMQRSGFEWLFRMLQEPRRLFRRYVIDLVIFGSSFLRQWFVMRRPGSAQQRCSAGLDILQGKAVFSLQGCLTMDTLDSIYPVVQEALEACPNILVNLAKVTFLDSTAIGGLLELGRQARLRGGELALVGVPDRIYKTLALLKLEKLFPVYPDTDAYLAEWAFKTSAAPQDIAGLSQSSSGGRVWSVVKGRRVLDTAAAPVLIEAGTCALATSPVLICDLSETVILTSAGLAALAQLRQMTVNLQGEFRMDNCSQDVLRVIAQAHFDRVLLPYSDFSLAAT
jgi:N-acetylglucosaminyldiphosphoundecaprenol N-acetyl-beta-D-mannosaminyltransferase